MPRCGCNRASALLRGSRTKPSIRLAASSATARRPVARSAPGVQCPLPGDPSLTVVTNVTMGDKKADFMRAASKAVSECHGKPEAYVAVCVQDDQDVIWAGKDTPCAICTLNSIGAISMDKNSALSARLSSMLSEFDIPLDRYYINFFDVPRENCGYGGATFANLNT